MIPFSSVSFTPRRPSVDTAVLRRPLPAGRLALTNQRLILVCINLSVENAIRKVNPSRKTQYLKNYWVDTSVTQCFSFFPIDIKNVMHIRFHMEVRIQHMNLSNAPTVSIMHIRSHNSFTHTRIDCYLSR